MPDLMWHEFIQINEAIDVAFELLCDKPKPLPMTTEGMLELNAKLEKIRKARELMVDLAGGNSR